MDILIIDPFYDTSHQIWSEGYQRHSKHKISILSLPPRYWKWRMYASAIELAKRYKRENLSPDLIIVSDMIDLALFKSLLSVELAKIPIALYFHENQLTYPWSKDDKDIDLRRDRHYAFTNYTSSLVADHIFFNSQYHMDSFLGELPRFLGAFPDFQNQQTVTAIQQKSSVLHIGLDLHRFDAHKVNATNDIPIVLWNHRWEYDKNPELFFNTLFHLKQEDVRFQLVVLGHKTRKHPKIFDTAQIELSNEIIHFGYAESFMAYAQWLWKADILPVTNIQDFFGISVVEAAYCQTQIVVPRRLTYPELFPEALFYEDDTILLEVLRDRIINFKSSEDIHQRNTAARFDWSQMIAQYDLMVDQVMQYPISRVS